MSTATGSIAFLGAARFQGTWDAVLNVGTSSSDSTEYSNLLNSSGYVAASMSGPRQGDYWQVKQQGTTNLNGTSSWALNDWVIYSGSAWLKMPVTDTIASIVIGDLSAVGAFNLSSSSNSHILFVTGTTDVNTKQSGSSKLTYNMDTIGGTGAMMLTGNMYVAGDVGIGTAAGAASAILDLTSTTKGLLPPRMTTTQRDAISSPADGLVIFNTTTDKLNVYDSSEWVVVGGTTINNATENELLTVASTTTELDAEANLTFDGNKLSLTGSLHSSGLIAAAALGNAAAISSDTVIPAGHNYVMYGPITINDTKTLTITDTANLRIRDISDA